MLKTSLCDLLGIEYPIFQGAMANIADGTFAAAVSNAGGLGIIAISMNDAAYVREQVAIARGLTDKPFAVNLHMQNPQAAEIAQVLIDLQVAVITTGGGNPAPYVPAWVAAGCKVIPVLASVKIAKRMEAIGATAVVAEGTESGGHIGEMTTMALVPQVVDAVKIPVIAAGGIADGRGLMAALMLGAVGVQMGTAFLVADECPIGQAYKDRVLAAIDTDTVVTGRGTKNVVRALRNELTDDINALGANPDPAALQALTVGALPRAVAGDTVHGSLAAGQIAGLVHESQSVAQIIQTIMQQATELAAQKFTLI